MEEKIDDEIWVCHPEIAGLMASSLGRIQFPSCTGYMPNGNIRHYITKPVWGYEDKKASRRDGVGGRLQTHFRGKNYKIHKVVCEAFHGPKPTPAAIVLHIDENPQNNRPENLRWGTRKENQNFPKAVAAFKARTGDNSPWAIYLRRKAADPSYRSRYSLKNN